MKKYTNKIILILITSLLCITAITGGVFVLNKKISEEKPPEPIAHGNLSIAPYWIFKTDEDVISTPATNGNLLFVKTSSSLYAIDIVQRKVQWRVDSFTQQKLGLAPLATGYSVAVVENGSSLAVYSIDSGKLLWRSPAIDGVGYRTASVQSIASNGQYIYVGRFDLRLTAYNLKTGEIAWDHSLPGRTNPYIEANEKYVFLGAGETLTVLDANYGRELWKKDDIGYAGPILLNENTLYIADEKYVSLISLDVNTHKVNWEANYQQSIRTYNFSCILEAENYLLVAARKLMMISKRDGEILWTTDDLGILECPILLEDKIYIRNSLTTLYVLDEETGHEVGQMLVQMNSRMKHDFFRGPVAANGFLVIPFGDNRIFIYQKLDL